MESLTFQLLPLCLNPAKKRTFLFLATPLSIEQHHHEQRQEEPYTTQDGFCASTPDYYHN